MDKAEVLKKLEKQIAQLNVQFVEIQKTGEKIPKLEMDRMLSDIRATYELFTVLNYLNTYGSLPPSVRKPQPVVTEQPEPVEEKKPEPVVPTPEPQPEPAPVIEKKAPPPTEVKKEPTAPKPEPVIPQQQPTEILQETLADKFRQGKVTDLQKVIPLHEKFLYINELFEGENGPYNEFIDMINGRTSWTEAETLLQHEAEKHQWDLESKVCLQFFDVIRRKF